MKRAPAKAPEWPKIIRSGSAILKTFANLNEAIAEREVKATTLANGELDTLHLRAEDARVYAHCVDMSKAAGIPLDLLVNNAVEVVEVVDGKVSLLEMAKEFKRRKMHELPDNMLPVAVDEMIETLTKDSIGDAYVRVLKVYLNQIKESFNCQLRKVATEQFADYLRNQDVSARSKTIR